MDFILLIQVFILRKNVLVGLANYLFCLDVINVKCAVLHIDAINVSLDELLDFMIDIEFEHINSPVVCENVVAVFLRGVDTIYNWDLKVECQFNLFFKLHSKFILLFFLMLLELVLLR
jgi:hypothetical protein